MPKIPDKHSIKEMCCFKCRLAKYWVYGIHHWTDTRRAHEKCFTWKCYGDSLFRHLRSSSKT